MTDRISNMEAQILELFRQLRPEQKKAVLLSVLLSSLAAGGAKPRQMEGRHTHEIL